MALLNHPSGMTPIPLVMVSMTPQGIQELAPKDITVPPVRINPSSSRRATLLPVAVRMAATATPAFSSLSNLLCLTPDMAEILKAAP